MRSKVNASVLAFTELRVNLGLRAPLQKLLAAELGKGAEVADQIGFRIVRDEVTVSPVIGESHITLPSLAANRADQLPSIWASPGTRDSPPGWVSRAAGSA